MFSAIALPSLLHFSIKLFRFFPLFFNFLLNPLPLLLLFFLLPPHYLNSSLFLPATNTLLNLIVNSTYLIIFIWYKGFISSPWNIFFTWHLGHNFLLVYFLSLYHSFADFSKSLYLSLLCLYLYFLMNSSNPMDLELLIGWQLPNSLPKLWIYISNYCSGCPLGCLTAISN